MASIAPIVGAWLLDESFWDAASSDETSASEDGASSHSALQNATRDAVKRFKDKGKQTGNFINDATNDGIGVSEIRNLSPVPAGLTDKLKQALADMKSGKLKPIP